MNIAGTSAADTAEIKVIISTDTTELDKAIEKAKELSALLKGLSETTPELTISD